MRNAKVLFALFICTVLFLYGNYRSKTTTQSVTDTINIGEYVFHVEEALSDGYNTRVRYSLRRQDNCKMVPMRFNSLCSHNELNTHGGNVQYCLSADGRTVWIEEMWSSAQKAKHNAIHTVVLNNLTFGDESDSETVEGTWVASYEVQTIADYIQPPVKGMQIQLSGGDSYSLQLRNVQISDVGIHVKMETPDYDITNLANHFQAHLVMKDGTVTELEFQHSIHGKKAPFIATGGAVFHKAIALTQIYALVICGKEIPIADKPSTHHPAYTVTLG